MTMLSYLIQLALFALVARMAFLWGRATTVINGSPHCFTVALTPESAREMATRLTLMAYGREMAGDSGKVLVEVDANSRTIFVK